MHGGRVKLMCKFSERASAVHWRRRPATWRVGPRPRRIAVGAQAGSAAPGNSRSARPGKCPQPRFLAKQVTEFCAAYFTLWHFPVSSTCGGARWHRHQRQVSRSSYRECRTFLCAAWPGSEPTRWANAAYCSVTLARTVPAFSCRTTTCTVVPAVARTTHCNLARSAIGVLSVQKLTSVCL